MDFFLLALGLLTTLPVRSRREYTPGDSGRAAVWYPWVGLLLGGLVAGAYRLLALVLPPLGVAALTLALWVVLTGGLHLDGLADCCDGLPHPSNPQRRLEIMKDSRLGAFGGIGLGVALLLKWSALASLPIEHAMPAILLAACLGRWSLIPAGLQPLARPGGMGADFAAGLQRRAVIAGAFPPLMLVTLLGIRGLWSLFAGLFALIVIQALARKRLGGVTGDVFGLIVETTEIVVLLAMSILPSL